MEHIFLIILTFLPSLIWLLFYLRKDSHPESNQMILKIFSYGMGTAILASFVEFGFFRISAKLPLSSLLILILDIFIGVAFVEELFKYLVVRKKVLSSPELDEPIDIMLYMIIAGLGFAVIENFFYLYFGTEIFSFEVREVLTLVALRFILATFLHTLTSGAFGYFLALSFLKTKKRFIFFGPGLFLATLLHGFYNFSIIKLQNHFQYLLPIIIIGILAIFVFWGLRKLKRLKSVCEIY